MGGGLGALLATPSIATIINMGSNDFQGWRRPQITIGSFFYNNDELQKSELIHSEFERYNSITCKGVMIGLITRSSDELRSTQYRSISHLITCTKPFR